MAHTYSHLYDLPTTGLPFVTDYGPWGRPDMALLKFTKAILAGEKIQVFNYGKHRRDFTYIDDIVGGAIRVHDPTALRIEDWGGANPDPGSGAAPWRVYNIANNSPVELMDHIAALEKSLGKKAKIDMFPLQPADVPNTYANVSDFVEHIGYKPCTTVELGVANIVSS